MVGIFPRKKIYSNINFQKLFTRKNRNIKARISSLIGTRRKDSLLKFKVQAGLIRFQVLNNH